MQTLLYFIIALGVLIFVHELGHFLAARFFKVKVETFSIGFGPKLFKFNCLDTEFTISLIPLGGYVKMSGENPDEPAKNPYDFYAKPPWQRIIIALAGPIMNLVLAIAFFAFTFSIGRYVPTYQLEMAKVGTVLSEKIPLKPGDVIISAGGEPVKNWKDFTQIVALNPNKDLLLKVKRNGEVLDLKVHTGVEEKNGIGTLDVVPAIKPIIGKVVSGSPAEKAGLKPGDIILSINGKDIVSWEQVVKIIGKSDGKPLKILVLRKDKRVVVSVTPQFNDKFKRYTIGIVPKMDMTFVKYPFIEAIKKGVEEFKAETSLFFAFLYKLITGQASMKSLGGPIMIAEVAGKAAEAGMSNFLYFMGFISLQLGYFNLLPLPVLDGGLILMFLIEMIRRRPLSMEFRERFQQVGFAILAFLMIIVFYNDIMRLLN
ncbi:membrane-associated zinc metalloprotease [Desulfurobacterium thermolithotrophum DSM 11699]|uniref:Zinc metalloprotease n=1 Tax=Desulfurobacterium thermolithotrophum (strain DSM 11699 / BSA) TaxID=868864 RepID=F0S2D8_DESTD|nr:RIP metalloprotease RseP [Desulfurobacterium thermolithotrophum]ADY74153.1 membrane-associated zinc metalloprotease [Desulfurobacterium thermolithotrophum DSM 11699]